MTVGLRPEGACRWCWEPVPESYDVPSNIEKCCSADCRARWREDHGWPELKSHRALLERIMERGDQPVDQALRDEIRLELEIEEVE